MKREMEAPTNDEDDEVIRELDVYVKDAMDLYLLQFPLKPIYADPVEVKSAKIKPNHHKLELTVPMISNSNNSATNHVAYTSSNVLPSNVLGVGFINSGKFFISPLSATLQMRPSLQTPMGIGRHEIVEPISAQHDYPENSISAESSTKEATSTNLQQVQLKRRESERAQNARLQSYSYIKQQEEAEQWQQLQIHHIGSEASDSKFSEIAASLT